MGYFNPADWFWVVAGNDTKAYASARNIYVPLEDEAYVAWLANGNTGTGMIASEADIWPSVRGYLPAWLFDGTTFAQPAAGQYTQTQLASYAAEARRVKMQGDIVVNGLPFSTDAVTYSSLNSAYIYTQSNAGAVFSWKLPDGTFITLNKADVDALQAAANEFAQDCFKCEDLTLDKIEAGTITDLPQIDTEFAAISNSFTGLTADAKKVRHKRG